MTNSRRTARLAGLLYLVVILTGMFSLAYVPSKLIFPDDPVKTLQAISLREELFRGSIAASLLCYLAFLALPVILYRLLRSVNEWKARWMLLLAVVSVPISLLNLQHRFGILPLLDSPALSLQEAQYRLMEHLRLYSSGITIVKLFWGLWLLPLGLLIYRLSPVSKIIGVLLMLGCVGYVSSVFLGTLVPGFNNYSFAGYITLPAAAGEIGTCLWLLVARGKLANVGESNRMSASR